MIDTMLRNLENPGKLERLYRQDPGSFKKHFAVLYARTLSSPVLEAWKARLFFGELIESTRSRASRGNVLLLMLVALVVGSFARLPIFFNGINSGDFFMKNLGFFLFPGAALLLLFFKQARLREYLLVLSPMAIALVFVNLIPPQASIKTTFMRDCMELVYTHMPVLLLALTAWALCGRETLSAGGRLKLLRNGATILLYTMFILLGGLLFSGLTMGLFLLLSIPVDEFYITYVAIYGSVAAPLTAVYLTQLKGPLPFFSRLLSRAFLPLVTIALGVFAFFAMGDLLFQGAQLIKDKDSMVLVNFTMLITTSLIIFNTIDEADEAPRGFFDYQNVVLTGIAVFLELFVLGTCVYWIADKGLTPVRIAATALNILVLSNYIYLLFKYGGFLSGKIHRGVLKEAAGQFLPAYGLYALGVVTLIPAAYGILS